MTIQIIIGVLLLAALVYAWYTERTRRREAELERDLATRRTVLDGIQKQLDEGKTGYDSAKEAFDAAPVPPDMLEYLGRTTDEREFGRKAALAPDPRFHRPGLDGAGAGTTGEVKAPG